MEGTVIFCLYEFIVRLAVPFFFMVSGFLLFSKIEINHGLDGNMEILKIWLRRTIGRYLIWHVMYLPIAMYGIDWSQINPIKVALQYLMNLVCVGQQWYSWPLWYLLSSIYAVTFFTVMIKIGVKKRTLFILSLAVYLLSFAMTYLADNAAVFEGIVGLVSKLITETFGNGCVFTGVGYMAVGMMCTGAKHIISVTKSAIVLGVSAAVAVLLFMADIMFTETPLLIIPAYALFCIGKSWAGTVRSKVCEYCRKTSTSIYSTHMILFFLGGLLFWGFEGTERYGVLPFIWTLGLSLMLSVVVYCFRNTKVVKRLFAG